MKSAFGIVLFIAAASLLLAGCQGESPEQVQKKKQEKSAQYGLDQNGEK